MTILFYASQKQLSERCCAIYRMVWNEAGVLKRFFLITVFQNVAFSFSSSFSYQYIVHTLSFSLPFSISICCLQCFTFFSMRDVVEVLVVLDDNIIGISADELEGPRILLLYDTSGWEGAFQLLSLSKYLNGKIYLTPDQIFCSRISSTLYARRIRKT